MSQLNQQFTAISLATWASVQLLLVLIITGRTTDVARYSMQMSALTVLLAVARGGAGWVSPATTAGVGLLGIALVLTFWSLVAYMIALWPYLSGERTS